MILAVSLSGCLLFFRLHFYYPSYYFISLCLSLSAACNLQSINLVFFLLAFTRSSTVEPIRPFQSASPFTLFHSCSPRARDKRQEDEDYDCLSFSLLLYTKSNIHHSPPKTSDMLITVGTFLSPSLHATRLVYPTGM